MFFKKGRYNCNYRLAEDNGDEDSLKKSKVLIELNKLEWIVVESKRQL